MTQMGTVEVDSWFLLSAFVADLTPSLGNRGLKFICEFQLTVARDCDGVGGYEMFINEWSEVHLHINMLMTGNCGRCNMMSFWLIKTGDGNLAVKSSGHNNWYRELGFLRSTNQSFSEPPSAQDLTPVVYGVGIVSKPDSVEMKQEPLGKDTDVVKVFDERLKTTGDNVQTMEYSNKKCNHFSVAYEGHITIDNIGMVTVMSIVNICNRTYKSDDIISDGMFSMDRSCCKSIKGSVRAYSIENAKTGVSRARDSIGLSDDNNSVCENSNFVALQLVLESTFAILSVNHVVLDEIVRNTLYNYELEMHVEDENDPSLLTREEIQTPKVCAQIYVQRMVELVKENTTLHQVLDPMLMYFDSGHHWIFQHGLLMEDLFDMSYRDASGSQQLILVVALISTFNHWELMNETGAGLMAETYKLKGSRNNELGVAVWVALLSDCCNHGKSSIGKMVTKMVLE
ncbi:hypothetical protein V6N13_055828 [Hibiscus sabdariffa]